MGACNFEAVAEGKTVREAFDNAVSHAAYEHGHGGYTGTIAEKREYVVIDVPDEWKDRPKAYARQLIEDDDARITDKWGPAGAIQLASDRWLFFGYASS